MTMDGGGWGEDTQSFRFLLDRIFNYRDRKTMTDILDNEEWKNRKDHLTPNYLTDIEQIMTI